MSGCHGANASDTVASDDCGVAFRSGPISAWFSEPPVAGRLETALAGARQALAALRVAGPARPASKTGGFHANEGSWFLVGPRASCRCCGTQHFKPQNSQSLPVQKFGKVFCKKCSVMFCSIYRQQVCAGCASNSACTRASAPASLRDPASRSALRCVYLVEIPSPARRRAPPSLREPVTVIYAAAAAARRARRAPTSARSRSIAR